MIDRKQIKMDVLVDRPVAAANAIAIHEGMVLCSVIEAGIEKVQVIASPAGTEKIAGIAYLPYDLPAQATAAEKFTVPASGSLIFDLRNKNVVNASVRGAVAGGSDLTVDYTFAGTPSTGTVKVDLAGGRVKFAAGDAGKVVTIIYRYDLTINQAMNKFHERSINNRGLVSMLGMVSVAKGYIEISTDQFDTTANWAAPGSDKIVLGANGKLTLASSGAEIPGAKVLAVPDLSGSLQGAMLKISALIP